MDNGIRAAALAMALAAAAGPAWGQRFEDVAGPAGVDFAHFAGLTAGKRLIEAMGSGLAIADLDGDGRLDLYFANGAPGPAKTAPRHRNRLYLNRGGWRFEDATERSGAGGRGYSTGVAAGDLDGDGLADLAVAEFGRLLLYRNLGGGRFAESVLPGDGWLAAPAILDYDGDGRPDLFVSRYLDWDFARSKPCGEIERPSFCHPREFGPVPHLLLRNLGGGKFEDVSEQSGIARHPGKGLGVAVADFDGDGWPDVFVANDSYPQQLFRNRGDGTFVEVAVAAGAAYDEDGATFAGMGVVAGDFDNDGRLDLFVNALGRQGYWLYRNRGGGRFGPVSRETGLASASRLRSGWGAGLVDFDNDGWRDLFVAQGHVMDDIERSDPALAHREPLMLLKNVAGRFFDAAATAGAAFARPFAARGAAFGDLDGDGLVDIVVSTLDGPPLVLRNTTPGAGAWLAVPAPLGARVVATLADGRRLTGYAGGGGSYLSSSDASVHLGLGPGGAAVRVEVTPASASARSEF